VVEHPVAWAPEARDLVDPDTGLMIRLSDHNPVRGKFSLDQSKRPGVHSPGHGQ
jgi:hypothetical protein